MYIFTDHMTGAASGASPGYGITLVAETTSGRLLAAEAAAALDRGGAAGAAGAAAADVEEVVPEDIGQRAAHLLLEEIQRGGVVDSSHQVRCAGSYGLLPCLAAFGCRAAAGWHQTNSPSADQQQRESSHNYPASARLARPAGLGAAAVRAGA